MQEVLHGYVNKIYSKLGQEVLCREIRQVRLNARHRVAVAVFTPIKVPEGIYTHGGDFDQFYKEGWADGDGYEYIPLPKAAAFSLIKVIED